MHVSSEAVIHSKPCLSHCDVPKNHLGSCYNTDFDSARLGGRLRFCISNKFLDDATTACSWTVIWTTKVYNNCKWKSHWQKREEEAWDSMRLLLAFWFLCWLLWFLAPVDGIFVDKNVIRPWILAAPCLKVIQSKESNTGATGDSLDASNPVSAFLSDSSLWVANCSLNLGLCSTASGKPNTSATSSVCLHVLRHSRPWKDVTSIKGVAFKMTLLIGPCK